jgi:hypothetical protein
VLPITSPIVLISRIPTKLNILITFIAGVTALLSSIHVLRIRMQRAWSRSAILDSKTFIALRNTIFHFADEWATLAGKIKANLSKQQRNEIRGKPHYFY